MILWTATPSSSSSTERIFNQKSVSLSPSSAATLYRLQPNQVKTVFPSSVLACVLVCRAFQQQSHRVHLLGVIARVGSMFYGGKSSRRSLASSSASLGASHSPLSSSRTSLAASRQSKFSGEHVNRLLSKTAMAKAPAAFADFLEDASRTHRKCEPRIENCPKHRRP